MSEEFADEANVWTGEVVVSTPTPRLRFVIRNEQVVQGGTSAECARQVRILQQKWVIRDGSGSAEEWRDVPLEES